MLCIPLLTAEIALFWELVGLNLPISCEVQWRMHLPLSPPVFHQSWARYYKPSSKLQWPLCLLFSWLELMNSLEREGDKCLVGKSRVRCHLLSTVSSTPSKPMRTMEALPVSANNHDHVQKKEDHCAYQMPRLLFPASKLPVHTRKQTSMASEEMYSRLLQPKWACLTLSSPDVGQIQIVDGIHYVFRSLSRIMRYNSDSIDNMWRLLDIKYRLTHISCQPGQQ